MRKLHISIIALLAFAVHVSSAMAQDAKNGEEKAAMCIGCHGIPAYQASFPEVHKVPMIAGQGAPYIVAALTAYKTGERKHPTMRAIAGSLSEKDMADLAAFYSTEAKNPLKLAATPHHEPSPEVAALLIKGNCTACHGKNFNTPIDPAYPKLAGQHADYLYVALKAYQTRNNAVVGRANPIMGGMSAMLNHAELKQVAQYIASLPGELQTVEQPRFK